MAAETPGRQTIKQDVEHSVGVAVDVGVTNFYVAAPMPAFLPECIRAMGWWFVDHDYR